MPLITVFTPTYNRARLLPRLYESLLRQTEADFEWIVVDDGSTDNTPDLINTIRSAHHAPFQIRYYRKPGGGKHTAFNLGVSYAKGELFFCADSDDFLPDDALHTVAEEWEKVRHNPYTAGIAGLDLDATTCQIAGTGLPQNTIDCNAIDIRCQYHVGGDLKEVFRTSVLRQYPFPEIKGERFCPEQLVWFRIAQKYILRYINKPLYIAEYQSEGLTANIVRLRMENPIATMMTYSEMAGYNLPWLQKVKAAVNYYRFRLCDGHHKADTPRPVLPRRWLWTVPIALVMHLRDIRTIHN